MNRELVLNLGKLMVAVAWVDGILAPQEIEALREVIAKIPGITSKEKAQIDICMSHPIETREREALIQLVADLIKTDEERELVVNCLRSTVLSDGEVTPEEEAALTSLERALVKAEPGVLRGLGQMLWKSVTRQQSQRLDREEQLDDFMRNRIFYYLMLDPMGEGLVIELGEDRARSISLYAGLMLRVACAGWSEEMRTTKEPPSDEVAPRLASLCEISVAQARIFVDIAWLGYTRGLDGFLLGTALASRMTLASLNDAFAAFFDIALHDDQDMPAAIEQELLDIAHSLQFSQEDIALSYRLYEYQRATS